MDVLIGGEKYRYCDDLLNDDALCHSFDALAHGVFGIRFGWWRQAGLWGDAYRPHVLARGGQVVACVGQSNIVFRAGGQTKNTVQLGTVMVDPAFRRRGLAAWLMRRVLDGLPANTDLVYLYANDGARDFYLPFGLAPAQEWGFSLPVQDVVQGQVVPVQAAPGAARKLDLENPDDLALLHQAAALGNPCANPTMLGNPGLVLFHCLSWLRESLYYVQGQNAVAAVQREGDVLHCLEVLGPPGVDLNAVLAALCGPDVQSDVHSGIQSIELGFAPAGPAARETGVALAKGTKPTEGAIPTAGVPGPHGAVGAAMQTRPLAQPDTTFMVLQGGGDFISSKQMRLPELSHA